MKPPGKHDGTRLDRRMTRPSSWPSPRSDPTCKLCGDAGWLVAVLRRAPRAEFTFRCSCETGTGLEQRVTAPRWTGDHRYQVVAPGGVPQTDAPRRGGADRAAGRDDDLP